LLKGKALADAKLLKEYNIKDGDTINLMIKPGNTWNPNVMTAPDSISASPIPSVVLSPSPSSVIPSNENSKPLDINLTLDTSSIPTASSGATDTAYHATISDPAFWQELLKLLQSVLLRYLCGDSRAEFLFRAHFKSTDDVHTAFEDFFCASKGKLTATEIAKIRNVVEVFGMAGT